MKVVVFFGFAILALVRAQVPVLEQEFAAYFEDCRYSVPIPDDTVDNAPAMRSSCDDNATDIYQANLTALLDALPVIVRTDSYFCESTYRVICEGDPPFGSSFRPINIGAWVNGVLEETLAINSTANPDPSCTYLPKAVDCIISSPFSNTTLSAGDKVVFGGSDLGDTCFVMASLCTTLVVDDAASSLTAWTPLW